ncbi:MAG: hypothetical protein ISS77_01615 [Phycisphaerae bacterium]|nr:hypothetical protein [Phycisphaerae bacterium]
MAKKKTKGEKLVTGTWLKDEIKLLKKIYSNRSTAEVAQELSRGFDAVKKKASRMGLKKTKTYMKKLGRG